MHVAKFFITVFDASNKRNENVGIWPPAGLSPFTAPPESLRNLRVLERRLRPVKMPELSKI